MGLASQEVLNILNRKYKYWEKALSEEAVWSSTSSVVFAFDTISFSADITLSDSLFSSLVADIIFGIPLIEIEPWNIDYRIELPSVDELLRGVLLKIEPITLNDIIPEISFDIAFKQAYEISLDLVGLTSPEQVANTITMLAPQISYEQAYELASELTYPITSDQVPQIASEIASLLEPQIEQNLSEAVTTPEASYEQMFTPETAETVSESKIEKGYYGISRYGQCYYDPTAAREFLRSAIYFMTKKPVDIATARNRVKAAAEALNVAPEIAEDVFNRLSMITAVKEKTLTFDYGWWDYSYFSASTEKTVEFIDYNLQVQELEYVDLFDAVAGCYWDVSLWNYCFFTEESDEYEHPWRENDFTILLRDRIVTDFRKRLMSTGMLVANYMLPRERQEFVPSGRLEVFAETTSQSLHIDRVVDSILDTAYPNAPPALRNMYRVAAKQIWSYRYSDNKHGLSMFKSMTVEEFKSWWIKYWSDQGLDPSILEKIWSSVQPVSDALGAVRVRDKFRFIRSKIKLG